MRDSGFEATSFEIVVFFLLVPSGGAAPFGDEAFAVGADGGERFVVVWFEEVGDADYGEF